MVWHWMYVEKKCFDVKTDVGISVVTVTKIESGMWSPPLVGVHAWPGPHVDFDKWWW